MRLWHEAHGWENSKALLVALRLHFKPLDRGDPREDEPGAVDRTGSRSSPGWSRRPSAGRPPDRDALHVDDVLGRGQRQGVRLRAQQAQAWNFPAANLEEDPFTIGRTRKNLVLTIPGQTLQSEVLLTAHLDSIWQAGNSSRRPGGQRQRHRLGDPARGGAHPPPVPRSDRTIKLIFFTGEEQGLFGSAAYTQDHSMAAILGVLNLDMFGYDAQQRPLLRDPRRDARRLRRRELLQRQHHDVRARASRGLPDHRRDRPLGPRLVLERRTSGRSRSRRTSSTTARRAAASGSDANPNYHTNNDTTRGQHDPSYAIRHRQDGAGDDLGHGDPDPDLLRVRAGALARRPRSGR